MDSIGSQTTRPLTLQRSIAQNTAVEEALSELVKQLAGTEIGSLTRLNETESNDKYDNQFQVAQYAKVKGRILDYRIKHIDQQVSGNNVLFHIGLHGRVCANLCPRSF